MSPFSDFIAHILYRKQLDKKTFLYFFILIITSLIVGIISFINANPKGIVITLFAFIFYALPSVVGFITRIYIPAALRCLIYTFIFLSLSLGDLCNFFYMVPYWNVAMHIIAGAIWFSIGVAIIAMLYRNKPVAPSIEAVIVTSLLISFSFNFFWELIHIYSGGAHFVHIVWGLVGSIAFLLISLLDFSKINNMSHFSDTLISAVEWESMDAHIRARSGIDKN